MSAIVVRSVRATELLRVAEILVAAFDGHPLRESLLPGPVRRRIAIGIGDTGYFAEAMLWGTALGAEIDGELAGVLAWLPPEQHPRGRLRAALLDLVRLPFLLCPPHGFAGFRVQPALDRFHRNEPSLYFTLAGTHPRLQRRGVASALISRMTEAADASGASVFLETSDARNVSLYAKHGFEIVDRAAPLPKGPEVLAMLRPARV